jgi:hypothetical protein
MFRRSLVIIRCFDTVLWRLLCLRFFFSSNGGWVAPLYIPVFRGAARVLLRLCVFNYLQQDDAILYYLVVRLSVLICRVYTCILPCKVIFSTSLAQIGLRFSAEETNLVLLSRYWNILHSSVSSREFVLLLRDDLKGVVPDYVTSYVTPMSACAVGSAIVNKLPHVSQKVQLSVPSESMSNSGLGSELRSCALHKGNRGPHNEEGHSSQD